MENIVHLGDDGKVCIKDNSIVMNLTQLRCDRQDSQIRYASGLNYGDEEECLSGKEVERAGSEGLKWRP